MKVFYTDIIIHYYDWVVGIVCRSIYRIETNNLLISLKIKNSDWDSEIAQWKSIMG